MSLALSEALAKCDALIAKLQVDAAGIATGSDRFAKQPVIVGKESADNTTDAKAIPNKAGKPAKPAKSEAKPSSSNPTPEETFSKAKLQVGQIAEVEELEGSDKLFRCQVDIGNGVRKQIVAGLRKHITAEALLNSKVVVILNLKAARLAGQVSEGMILAGVAKSDTYTHGALVKPLQPPVGAEAGEPVFLIGSQPTSEFPKEFKQWKKMLPFLSVQGGNATFNGKSLVSGAGRITLPSDLPDGASIS